MKLIFAENKGGILKNIDIINNRYFKNLKN